MQLNPYLNFDGDCEAAFKFYAETFGGDIEAMMRYGDMPGHEQMPAGSEKLVMHARMAAPGAILMGADAPPGMREGMPNGFHVSIHVSDPAEADRIYNMLAENGTVQMPIQETFWAARFGMMTDKFGTPWMINCEKPASGE